MNDIYHHFLSAQVINQDHLNPDFEPGIKPSSGGDNAMDRYCTMLFNQLPGTRPRARGGALIKDDVGRALPVLPG